jgi:hypothetical protein
MPVTRHPPHRSQRALLMHWAPASGDNAHVIILPYSCRLTLQGSPVQCPVLVSLYRIPLGQPPFLHLLRHRLVVTCLVRRLLRYYGAVRLPVTVRYCITPLGFSVRTLYNLNKASYRASRFPRKKLPCMHEVSDPAKSLYPLPFRNMRYCLLYT